MLIANIANNGIILLSLLPNATQISQPAYLSVFISLKPELKNTLYQWATRPEYDKYSFNEINILSVTKYNSGKENLPVSIKNGFRKCGLYAVNRDALGYTKCLLNNLGNISLNKTGESPVEKN